MAKTKSYGNRRRKKKQSLIKEYGKDKNNTNDVKYDNTNKITQGGGGEGIIYDINWIYLIM